jgi:outer membrane receptor for monomeric catechols
MAAIRGVDSSANFFVNGFRDDVQYFLNVGTLILEPQKFENTEVGLKWNFSETAVYCCEL